LSSLLSGILAQIHMIAYNIGERRASPMLALIKLPFKLLSLPLMIVCAGLSLLAKLCSNLSGYILSPLILFVFGCGVYTVIAQQWNQVLLLGIIELLFISALFGSVLIETIFDWFYAILKGFVQS